MATIERVQLENDKLNEEIEKIRLEKKKIELESIELNKKFYKKPQWWAFFTTAIGSAIGLIYLILNGTFSSIAAKTEASISLLKLEKAQFEIQRNKLDTLINEKNDSIKLLSNTLKILSMGNDTLRMQYQKLDKINNEIQKGISAESRIVNQLLDSINVLNKKINRDREQKLITNSLINDSFSTNSISMRIYPNLITNIMNVEISNTGKSIEMSILRIIHSSGVPVYITDIGPIKNLISYPIDISRFPIGNYSLQLVIANDIIKSIEFTKQ